MSSRHAGGSGKMCSESLTREQVNLFEVAHLKHIHPDSEAPVVRLPRIFVGQDSGYQYTISELCWP